MVPHPAMEHDDHRTTAILNGEQPRALAFNP
jgi:hypothetical protein